MPVHQPPSFLVALGMAECILIAVMLIALRAGIRGIDPEEYERPDLDGSKALRWIAIGLMALVAIFIVLGVALAFMVYG